MVIAWHLALTCFGFVTELIVKPSTGTIPEEITATSHTRRWDSGWYDTITKQFYNSGPGHEVFYPLFPLTVRAVQAVSFDKLSVTGAGLMVNVLATFFAAYALLLITNHHLKDQRIAWLATFSFLAFPTAFFMHAFYTEALFCALGFWAYLFALRRKWAYMGMCLALLTATRITSVLFVGLCAAEYLRACGWNLRKIRTSILWFLLAPLGFIMYGLYLLQVKGNFFAMLSAYDTVTDWAYQQFNPNFIYTFLRAVKGSLLVLTNQRPLDNFHFANVLLPTLALTLLFVSSLYALFKIRSWGLPLGLFGLTSFVFFTLNNNVVSSHRYALPCIVIYLSVAHAVRNSKLLRNAVLVGVGILAMGQVLLQTLFISGYFVG